MAPCIMAQSTDFEPPTPFFLNIAGGHPQTRSQDLASILKDVVIDQNGNDNPSHHTVLLLMELRANLENRHDFPNACQEPEPDSVPYIQKYVFSSKNVFKLINHFTCFEDNEFLHKSVQNISNSF